MAAAFIGPALEALGGAEAVGAAGAATEGLGAATAAEGAGASAGAGQALKGLNPAQFLGGGPVGVANAGVGFLNAAADALMSVIPATDANKD
jgi:hypothetical protein